MIPETIAHPKNTQLSSKGRARRYPKIADAAAMLISTQFCWWLINVARLRPSVVWAMPCKMPPEFGTNPSVYYL